MKNCEQNNYPAKHLAEVKAGISSAGSRHVDLRLV